MTDDRRSGGDARTSRGPDGVLLAGRGSRRERPKSRENPRVDQRILAKVFDSTAIGMGLIATDGRWLRVNEALCRIFGESAEDLQSRDLAAIFSPSDLVSPLATSQDLPPEETNIYETEKPYVRKDGRTIWVLISVSMVRGAAGEVLDYVAQVQDISERKEAELRLREATEELKSQKAQLVRVNFQLQELARIDALTGIFNRRVLDERLTAWFSVAQRFDRPLSLIMMDVDHFKRYNDDYGHPDGDQALRQIAKQMQLCCRESDVPARFGGEEFAIVCPETARFGALELAERVRRAVRELPLRHRRLTVSLGVANLKPADSADTLIRLADAALYKAKACGRDRVCFVE